MSVCGTGTYFLSRGFSRQCEINNSKTPNVFSPSQLSLNEYRICLISQPYCLDVQSNRTLRLSYCVPPSIKTIIGGTGISTCYPSPTPVGLSLTSSRADEPSSGNLQSIGGRDSHPSFATHTGILTSKRSTCPYDHASTPLERSPTIVQRTIHSFGNMFSPGTFSAQCHSTSELLRTL